MNLYLLTQFDNTGYDTFDGIVVAAEDEDYARHIPPYAEYWEGGTHDAWADEPANVVVKLIGKAVDGTKEGVILASFNAC